MSISDPTRKTKEDDDGKTLRHSMSPEDAEELRKLDAAVDRILKTVPEHPYILSAPCIEPRYHYTSKQDAESWQKNTPFSLNEERFQYMTFIYRDSTDSCFVVRSQVDEERDRLAQLRRINGTPSVNNSPFLKPTVAKKKITLSAYKDKLEQKKLSPESKAQKKVMEKDEAPVVNGTGSQMKPKAADRTSRNSVAPGQKRPRGDSDATNSSLDEKKDSAPIVKKARTLPPPTLNTSQNSPLNGAPHGLPPLLSPTFETNDWKLPPMLSPTLPANIEAALAREERPSARNDSSTSSSSLDKNAKNNVTSAPTSLKPTPTDRKDPKSDSGSRGLKAAPMGSLKIRKEKNPAVAARKSSDEQKGKKLEVEDSKPRPSNTPHKTESEPERKPRLIVRIKYGKKRRQQIERILRLPPRPTPPPKASKSLEGRARASSAASERRDRLEHSSKAKDVPTPNPAKKAVISTDRNKKEGTPEKRPRGDDNDGPPSAKRQKLPTNLELDRNPRTPNQPPLISPAFQKSGGSMKSHLTPRDGHGQNRGTAMARSASNETSATTPEGRPSAYPTPLAKAGERGPTSAPANGRTAESITLANKSKQLNELGRKLKHQNQAVLNKPKDEITEADRKKAALLGLECIMTYMVAYGLGDARARVDRRPAEIESTYRSMLPLFKFLGQSSRPFRQLEGLRYHLGIAICSRIQTVIQERLGRAASSAQSSQQVGGRSDSPQLPFTPTEYANNVRISIENWSSLLEFTREANAKLPHHEIESSFPKTWDKMATGLREKDSETLINNDGEADCSGNFWLPVGIDTSPVQAVRFGLRLLKEWVQKEELEYGVQLKL